MEEVEIQILSVRGPARVPGTVCPFKGPLEFSNDFVRRSQLIDFRILVYFD